MKKIFTLVFITFAFFSTGTVAQTNTACTASFTYTFLNGTTIQFIPAVNNDSVLVHHTWFFGDGNVVQNIYAPSHTYANSGSYTVTQYVTKIGTNQSIECTDTVSETVVIPVIDPLPCNIQSYFISQPDSLQSNKIYFTNETVNLAGSDSSYWTFGDSTTSRDLNPTHVYAQAGTYNACLTVTRITTPGTKPCTDKFCKTVTITMPVCNITPKFTWKIDTLTRTVYFTNTTFAPSTLAVPSIWFFGDDSSSTSWSAIHTYAQPGKYYVCLRLQPSSNCIKYQCDSITIPAPLCNIKASYSWKIDSLKQNTIDLTNTTILPPTLNPIPIGESIWVFGDGSPLDSSWNTTHTYTQPGKYYVCLRVQITPNCVSYQCDSITIPTPVVCNLQAYFNDLPDSLQYNKIHFTDYTTNLLISDSSYWTFGDSTTSRDVNPIHVYAKPGTYNVCLTISRITTPGTIPCTSKFCRTVVIQPACNIKVAYTWEIDSLNQKTVDFINTTALPISATSAIWSFGDGSQLDSTWNATHTFAQSVKYYVCLRIQTNNTCINYQCDSIIVPPPAVCNLQAYFNSTIDSLNYSVVYFHNYTTNLATTDSSIWTFGDGTISYDINPTHSFADTGTYNVCLHVKRILASGTAPCISEFCRTVTITQPCNFKIGYTWALATANTNEVHFTNTSAAPSTASVRWSFGDGSPLDSTWNATHIFAKPGKYYVCLRIQTNPNCIKYQCDSIIVPAPIADCQQLSLFSFTTAATNSQYYTFTPTYPATNVQYTWTFGDNDGSENIIASHHYLTPGIYTACLTAYRDSNCASTTCKDIVVRPQINCDSINAYYNYYQNGNEPNIVYFYTTLNFPVTQQSWTITSLMNTATSPIVIYGTNPVYVFTDTGYYRVCLRVITIAGCVKEYCNVIHIATIASPCELFAYPNPSHTQVSLNVQLNSPEIIHTYLYSSQNMLLSQIDQQGNTGNNIVTINTENLAAGFYTIKLIYGTRTCYAKFQKL